MILIFLQSKVNSNKSDLLTQKYRIKQASFPILCEDIMKHASEEEASSSIFRMHQNYD